MLLYSTACYSKSSPAGRQRLAPLPAAGAAAMAWEGPAAAEAPSSATGGSVLVSRGGIVVLATLQVAICGFHDPPRPAHPCCLSQRCSPHLLQCLAFYTIYVHQQLLVMQPYGCPAVSKGVPLVGFLRTNRRVQPCTQVRASCKVAKTTACQPPRCSSRRMFLLAHRVHHVGAGSVAGPCRRKDKMPAGTATLSLHLSPKTPSGQ